MSNPNGPKDFGQIIKNGGANVPDLAKAPTRAGVQSIGVLIRQLDENGTYEPEKMVRTPTGYVAVTGRHNFMDAEELIEAIADRVVEKLQGKR